MKMYMSTAALLACLVPCLTAHAKHATQDITQDMRPGLWELTNNVSSSNPQMQTAMDAMRAQLANMSPEQRQSLQQLMERNGVQLDVGAGGALRSRMCVTREMLARKEVPMQQGDCAYRMTPLDANRLQVNLSCTRPNVSGAGEMTVDSPTRYHARITLHDRDRPSQAVDMQVDGHWLAASCGTVRPVQVPSVKAR